MSEYSPMMTHYLTIKKTLPDTLVFYRLGDFYEMFFDDAKVASTVLELVLTGRNAGVKERVPMCGVPAHTLNAYLNRLVNNGYKVAIVDQMEEATGKTIVKREIVRIVTPGTNLEDQQETMIATISESESHYYLALYNINVGVILLHRIKKDNNQLQLLLDEFKVKELVCENKDNLIEIKNIIISLCSFKDEDLSEELSALVVDEPLYQNSIKRLLLYLQTTQKQTETNIKEIKWLLDDSYMQIDYQSKLNLELCNNRYNTSSGSLYSFLNHCLSSLGNRTLKQWIEQPLRNLEQIQYRLKLINYLNQEFILKNTISENLKSVYDIERIISRIIYGQISHKELLTLKTSIKAGLNILALLDEEIWNTIKVKDNCEDVHLLLEEALNDDPQVYNQDNQIFKKGFNKELDGYRDILLNGEKWIFEMENQIRLKTGIKNLKIGYNKVFGYYIEVSKGNVNLIKEEFGFIRKQTLVNGERYITEQLKQKEEEILRCSDLAKRLEKELFKQLVEKVSLTIDKLQKLATMLGWVDAICCLAEVSSQYGYVEPTFNDEGILEIKEGKHPILAAHLKDDYVANSCYLDNETTTLLITGPNMGGKSTYIRQIALGVIMAQMGCFVPAKSFNTMIFDKIFTRMGASDDITGGQSTFMVEMNEANLAMQNATVNSLVLFDELGRGTSTYDGMSLAQAMIEYLTVCIKCKVLFSTHYHELVQLEDTIKNLRNVFVKVEETKNQIVFLYKVDYGKANKSYGINVAKLARLPKSVIDRAAILLKEYEQNHRFRQNEMIVEMVKEDPRYKELKKAINEIDIEGITPLKALNLLSELKTLCEENDE